MSIIDLTGLCHKFTFSFVIIYYIEFRNGRKGFFEDTFFVFNLKIMKSN